MAGQPRVQLANGQAGKRIAPGGRDRGGGGEDEGALAEQRVRDRQRGRAEGTAAPQHQIEVEHAGAPALAARAAAEVALDALEQREQGFGVERRLDYLPPSWRSGGSRGRWGRSRSPAQRRSRARPRQPAARARPPAPVAAGRTARGAGSSRARSGSGGRLRRASARLTRRPCAWKCPSPRPSRRAIARYARGWSPIATSCAAPSPEWWNAPVPCLGRSAGMAGDRWARPRTARRQPHRAAVHRRRCRRLPVRRAG